jgi:hypothetical protein
MKSKKLGIVGFVVLILFVGIYVFEVSPWMVILFAGAVLFEGLEYMYGSKE